MFERYTESARRALFFARYKATQLGATVIETEHVLLGLTRESQGLVARILALSQLSLESLRREIEGRSAETHRVLRFAAAEADRLRHSDIGTEHLLLGLLREESSVAASILTRHGLRLDDVRNTVVKLLAEPPTPSTSSTRANVSEQIDHSKQSVGQLAGMPPDSSEAHALADRIRDSLEGLKRHLDE